MLWELTKKIQFLRGWEGKGFTKNPLNMEDCLKRRFGQLADVIGGLPKNRGLYFLKG